MTAAAKAQAHSLRTLLARTCRSFIASAGSIVFGMEDGTVSIFGLVFGVAAAAPDSHAVLLAGGTGAVAAAVSMMAGTYLEVESTNDQLAARAAEERARYEADGEQWDEAAHGLLMSAGFTAAEASTFVSLIRRHPRIGLRVVSAVNLGVGEVRRKNPFVQSAWMFLADLLAAAVPVIPFAFFTLATARVVSLSVTVMLLVLLGIGRSMIGHRRILPTVGETIAIATAAGGAGLAVGKLIS